MQGHTHALGVTEELLLQAVDLLGVWFVLKDLSVPLLPAAVTLPVAIPATAVATHAVAVAAVTELGELQLMLPTCSQIIHMQ